jgi:hypothetical protein
MESGIRHNVLRSSSPNAPVSLRFVHDHLMQSQSVRALKAVTEEDGLQKCNRIETGVPFECREAIPSAELLFLRSPSTWTRALPQSRTK